MNKTLLKSMVWLFLAQACVGVNIVLSKGLVNHINPIVIMTIRFTFASIFMLLLLMKNNDAERFKLGLQRNDWLVLFAKAIGAGVAFNFIMLSGLHYTDANSAGLITSLLPAVVICLNILLFRQKMTAKMMLSIMISICGLILINYGALGSQNSAVVLGNFLIFISLIPDGLYYTLSKYYPLKMNNMLKVFMLNAINVPILFIIILFLPANLWSMVSLHDWTMLVIIGINSGLFFIFWQKGIKSIDAAYAALSTAFMPLTTVILAWVILGEGLTLNKFIGMMLVMMSIVVYARK